MSSYIEKSAAIIIFRKFCYEHKDILLSSNDTRILSKDLDNCGQILDFYKGDD